MQAALIPPAGMVLLCVLPFNRQRCREVSHPSQLFCELRARLLFQRKLSGVLIAPRVMLAAVQVCKKELYPQISSREMVAFITRAYSDCVWDHVCSSAFRLEKVCRGIIVGNRRRKSMSYLKTQKELSLFSLTKWRLEGTTAVCKNADGMNGDVLKTAKIVQELKVYKWARSKFRLEVKRWHPIITAVESWKSLPMKIL